MRFNSIRFKTSILFTSILCFILLAYSSVLYFTVRSILYKDVDRELRFKTDQISGILNAYAKANKIDSYPLALMRKLLSDHGFNQNEHSIIDELWDIDVKSLNLRDDFFQVLNRKGQPLLRSGASKQELMNILKNPVMFSLDHIYFSSIKRGGTNFRVINFPFLYNRQVPLLIQLATPLDPVTEILQKLLLFIIISILVILVLTCFMGNFLTTNILKPIVSVINMANSVTHKDLGIRIKKTEVDHEMESLINSFNTMIERLEASFTHINEFSSHAAHELKTPLAIMRGEIELVLSSDHNKEEYKRVLSTALQEVDRMIKITKDLLLLAKLDFNPNIFKCKKDDIVVFIKEIHDHSKILASQKQIELNLKVPDKEIFVEYDQIHLRRLFFNLIHNAVKFTSQGGKILISLLIEDKKACISVADSGKGIPTENLSKIFEKFYYADNNEHKTESGHGLGLTIAQSIARAHSGEITVKSQLGEGTTFTVILPLV